MTRVILDDDTYLGELLTFEEFARLDHQQLWDDLTHSGCCGAPGVIFRHKDGNVALEDGNSVYLEDDDNDDGDGDGDDEDASLAPSGVGPGASPSTTQAKGDW